MYFDLFDLIVIIAGIFYYIVMGFGFIGDANRVLGCKFSSIDFVAVALWPLFMFFRALFSFLDKDFK